MYEDYYNELNDLSDEEIEALRQPIMYQAPNPAVIDIGPVKVDYVNIVTPRAFSDKEPAKYSVTLIIPKTDTQDIQNINNALDAAYQKGAKKLKGNDIVVPNFNSLIMPYHDADMDKNYSNNPNYKNSYFIRASRKEELGAPNIFDEQGCFTQNRSLISSGDLVIATVTFSAYNVNARRGITCYLEELRKI